MCLEFCHLKSVIVYLLLTVVKTLTVHIVRMVKKGQNDPIDMAHYNGRTSV